MKYFFDTEFIEDGKTIDLLSIGMVAEDGRELYQCNQDANLQAADEWVIWNVYPHLGLHRAYSHEHGWHWEWDKPHPATVSRSSIREHVRAFVRDDQSPEFWAYYADYDWVVLCQLFGRMVDLPKGWPKYCRDLKQLMDAKGIDKCPVPQTTEHHALADAKWVRDAYLWVMEQ